MVVHQASRAQVEVIKFDGKDIAAYSEDDLLLFTISYLVSPTYAGAGDSRLFVPSIKSVRRREEKVTKNFKYLYVDFPTETTTRSGCD